MIVYFYVGSGAMLMGLAMVGGGGGDHISKMCKILLGRKPRYSTATQKPFALLPGIGLDPQRHNSALPIPTCWYLKNC